MNKNGRPNLGYSNIYWQRIERSPGAKIYNREELIQEILDEPIQLPIDRLQLTSLAKSDQGEYDSETFSIELLERGENSLHVNNKELKAGVV